VHLHTGAVGVNSDALPLWEYDIGTSGAPVFPLTVSIDLTQLDLLELVQTHFYFAIHDETNTLVRGQLDFADRRTHMTTARLLAAPTHTPLVNDG
jgi:hypothetical protein